MHEFTKLTADAAQPVFGFKVWVSKLVAIAFLVADCLLLLVGARAQILPEYLKTGTKKWSTTPAVGEKSRIQSGEQGCFRGAH
jgi:hypothetical protein